MKSVKKYYDKNNDIYVSFINPITEDIEDIKIGQDEVQADLIVKDIEEILNSKDLFFSYDGYKLNKDKYCKEALSIVFGNFNNKNYLLEKEDFFLPFTSIKSYNVFGSNINNIESVVDIKGNLLSTEYFECFIEFFSVDTIRKIVFDYIFETIYVMRNKENNFNAELFNTMYSILQDDIYVLNSYAVSIYYTEKTISEKKLFELPKNEFIRNMHAAINYKFIPKEIERIINIILDEEKKYIKSLLDKFYNVDEFLVIHKNGFSKDIDLDKVEDLKYVYIKIKTSSNLFECLRDNKIDKLIKRIRFKADGSEKKLYSVSLKYGDYNEYRGNSIINLDGDNLLSDNNIFTLFNALSFSLINITGIVFKSKNKNFNKDQSLMTISRYIKNNPIFIKRYNKDFYEEYKEIIEFELINVST